MRNHTGQSPKMKKLIAPIVVTALVVLYLVGFVAFFFAADEIPPLLKLLSCILPLPGMGVSIYVLVERIKEIRSGEEDDLSKY